MVELDQPVFVTGCGAFLPGEPVSGDQAERLLGCVDGRPSRHRRRVVAANGITTRHYALDTHGRTTMLNEELAARAVLAALSERGIALGDVGMLAAGTTQGDVLVPGFASMVHGRLGGGPLETLSAGGVCCSGMAAFKAAAASVRLGEHPVAVAVGSELASRSLKASRYEGGERPGFDAEFLRWMLSDGAGAVVLEGAPRPAGVSLRVDWVHLASYAHEHPTCMSAGTRAARPGAGETWLDQPTVAAAEAAGMLHLRQDVRALPGMVELGVAELARLTLRGLVEPGRVDHLLCHYSSEHFRPGIHRLLEAAGLAIPQERWFTNLAAKGNTGAASIFVMLEECWRTGRFRPGDRILLMVPESGRFTVAFAHLTCVAGPRPSAPARLAGAAPAGPPAVGASPVGASPVGEPDPEDSEVARWLLLQLALVWADFERRLRSVELVRRIEQGEVTLGEYRRLLVNLRQQVVDGGRWIARAASSMSAELFVLRSAFILHAGEEHRDYQLLEEDFLAVGGSLEEIQTTPKNVGSEALSAFIFHQAGQPDPIDLLGAMFVIEGLGAAKALRWAELLQAQLGLTADQVRFLRYHGANDDDHFELLRQLLRSPAVDRAAAERIVRTARVVARLYALQLEEIDHA
jgi:3-oxoacyl-[acyl-carrier-protein] synthase-3